jgi:hypothetical protein
MRTKLIQVPGFELLSLRRTANAAPSDRSVTFFSAMDAFPKNKVIRIRQNSFRPSKSQIVSVGNGEPAQPTQTFDPT